MNPKANHGLFAAITNARVGGEPLNEGLRLLKTYDHESGAKAKVYKDSEWQEHRVKFFNSKGEHLKDADYHTDDAEDAHDTAQHQLKNLKESTEPFDANHDAELTHLLNVAVAHRHIAHGHAALMDEHMKKHGQHPVGHDLANPHTSNWHAASTAHGKAIDAAEAYHKGKGGTEGEFSKLYDAAKARF